MPEAQEAPAITCKLHVRHAPCVRGHAYMWGFFLDGGVSSHAHFTVAVAREREREKEKEKERV